LKGKIVNLILLPIALILIVLALAPYFLGIYHLSVLREVLLWIALSISWHFFSGQTKYIALGSVAFVGTGLYFTARYLWFSVYKGYYPILPFPVIILLAGLINFAAALVIGSVTLRLRGIYFAIATFGIGEIFKGIIKLWEKHVSVPYIIQPLPMFDSQTIYYTLLITTLATILLTTLLRKSKFGLALRMIGECEEAAAHVGVNTSLYKTLGFAISAMCMGLIGGSYAIRFPSTNVDLVFLTDYSFLPAVMTLLGGMGTVYGPIIGSTTLALIGEYLRVQYALYFKLVIGFILIIIILFLPNGIMGLIGRVKSTKLFGRIKSVKGLKTPF
jgi:branched-chain amino acid transport system permease protein